MEAMPVVALGITILRSARVIDYVRLYDLEIVKKSPLSVYKVESF
jgi:hypothetical protein